MIRKRHRFTRRYYSTLPVFTLPDAAERHAAARHDDAVRHF